MLLSLLETILVMHLLERDKSPQSVSSRDQALSDEKEGNSIFPNFQGGESRNARVDQGRHPGQVAERETQGSKFMSGLFYCFGSNISSGVTNWSQCMPDMSAGETLSELLPVAREVRNEPSKAATTTRHFNL